MSSASSVLVTTKRSFALEILTMLALANFIQITSGDSYDVSHGYFVHIKGSSRAVQVIDGEEAETGYHIVLFLR
jgi:hypothetical protein